MESELQTAIENSREVGMVWQQVGALILLSARTSEVVWEWLMFAEDISAVPRPILCNGLGAPRQF